MKKLFKDSREFHLFCKFLKEEINKYLKKEAGNYTEPDSIVEIPLDTIKEIVLRYIPNEVDTCF